MELGKRITEIRKQNNMTQEDLAEKFHVTRQTISNWENGKSYPDIETLVCISNEFNVSLDMMLKGDDDMVRKITKEWAAFVETYFCNEMYRSRYSGISFKRVAWT